MATIKLDIVTAERRVLSEDVDEIVAPGTEGQLGILPHHAPLMTMINPGELLVKQSGTDVPMAISGGFMEVRPERVIILADAAERAEEIDIARAEEAKRRAEEQLAHPSTEVNIAVSQAALQRAISRLEVANKYRKRKNR
jgi:F-type H+-transporting ATPase subunit epsilon